MYYMSMEFLMGRSLLNALYNLQISGQYSQVGQSQPFSAAWASILPASRFFWLIMVYHGANQV